MSETSSSPQTPPAASDTADAAAPKPANATATAEKPAAAKPEAPAEPVEPPFSVDVLISCTARFTHPAWRLFQQYQKDITLIRTKPVRAKITTRSAEGAEVIHRTLVDNGVQEITRQGDTVSFTATFETIQSVIKHPETHLLEAAAIG